MIYTRQGGLVLELSVDSYAESACTVQLVKLLMIANDLRFWNISFFRKLFKHGRKDLIKMDWQAILHH